MKKKVLLVSYSYPPANAPAAQRPYAIAKYLDKEKYDVTVLSCSNQDSSMGLSDHFDPELPGVELIKVKSLSLSGVRKSKSSLMTTKDTGKSGVGGLKSLILKVLRWFMFPDKAIFWLPFVLRYAFKNRKTLKADVVWSTSPLVSNHLVARFLCSKSTKHIIDFRDYHYLHNEVNNKGFKGLLHKFIEKRILRKCTFASFTSEGMKAEYEKHYPRYADKFVAIYNGFDPDEFPESLPIPEHKKLTFFYAGSFYGGMRSPKPLLLGLEKLLENDEISKDDFSIEIAGNMEQSILKDIGTLKVYDSINFLGLLQRSEVLLKYTQSHVLWSIVSNVLNHYTAVPIKYYEYLGAKRYILNYAHPSAETSQLSEKLNCGWNLPNEDVIDEKHLNTLRTIFESYKNKELNVPLQLDNVVHFHRSQQTSQLEQLF